MTKPKSSVVGVRLSPQEIAKLDRLADRTFRGRGDVLRFILAHIEEAQLGGLSFDPKGATATAGSAASRLGRSSMPHQDGDA